MRLSVKAAIGLGVIIAALGAFFSVHAMTGGSASPKETLEASQTPSPGPANAPAVSAVCAPGHPDCVDATVVADSELTCEEANACDQHTIDAATPGLCDLGVACSNPSNGATKCPSNVAIEACYPAAQPAGPYVCVGDPASGTAIACKPPACTFPTEPNGAPEATQLPTCEPYPCGPGPLDASPTPCEPPPACPPTPAAPPDAPKPDLLRCAPPPIGPLPPD